MTLISSLDVIKPSPTMAVTARALPLRAEGVDVISLSAGEPDFATRRDGRRIADDTDLSLDLRDEARVAVVQGAACGLSPHVRLSFATSMELMDEAITRIAPALAKLS